MAGEMVQLTEYCDPTEWITSQYGKIVWRNYLQKEKERIEKSPGRVVEIRRGCATSANRYALFVNYVGVPFANGNYEKT